MKKETNTNTNKILTQDMNERNDYPEGSQSVLVKVFYPRGSVWSGSSYGRLNNRRSLDNRICEIFFNTTVEQTKILLSNKRFVELSKFVLPRPLKYEDFFDREERIFRKKFYQMEFKQRGDEKLYDDFFDTVSYKTSEKVTRNGTYTFYVHPIKVFKDNSYHYNSLTKVVHFTTRVQMTFQYLIEKSRTPLRMLVDVPQDFEDEVQSDFIMDRFKRDPNRYRLVDYEEDVLIWKTEQPTETILKLEESKYMWLDDFMVEIK